MNLDDYLARIGYEGPVAPDLATLRGMHRAHFLRVPFENLSIRRNERIVVDLQRNYDKIVTRGRGGFCLELNSLFAWALREIGFEVDVLGGRMMGPNGVLSPPLSHMTLRVGLDEDWLCDVGAGGRIPGPLRMAERAPQPYGLRNFTLAEDGDHWINSMGDPWISPGQPQLYVFTLQPRELDEYENVCHWLQTSPDSVFTRGDVISLGKDEGRVSYASGRLIVTTGDGREEVAVPEHDRAIVVEDRFGIRLD